LVVPAVVIPVFYIGLRYDWWGWGVGDGWQYVAAAITILTICRDRRSGGPIPLRAAMTEAPVVAVAPGSVGIVVV
jgi:hypothetical protein